MLSLKSFAAMTTASFVLFAGSSLAILEPVSAEAAGEAIGKVIAVKNSGYTTRLQQSVKHTIKVGDTLYAGDQIDVKSGNFVQIALDADKNNIIHIPGDAVVQITKDRAINVELNRGQVFALLDRLESGTKFRVVTPTAVSTVRGTYFGVKLNGAATQTSVYKGEVGVNGRQASGKALGAAIPVSAGDMTIVAHSGTRPQEPKRMTQRDFEEINAVIGTLNGLKKPLAYTDLALADPADAAAKSGSDKDIDLTNKDRNLDDEASSSGKVVF